MRSSHSKLNPDACMRGVTFLEIVVVLTITLILGAIAIPQLIQGLNNMQLRSAAAEVADLTQQARMSAARANATYPVRFQTTGGLQQAFIDLNNNSSLDTNEPSITLPESIKGASGAPTGTGGQPTAYTLVGDTTSGTPFDNSNVIAYSPRGLPCNYISSVCATPAASYFVLLLPGCQDQWVVGCTGD